ncbi:MAG: AsmA family protein [Candidatus Omnitrophota bacterium]
MKIIKWILIVVLVLIVILLIGRNVIVKQVAKFVVSAKTDLSMDIQKLDIGLFSSHLDVQGLKIYNPQGFQDPVMLDLPRLYIDYNLSEIIGGKLHLPVVIFHLNEFVLIKQADGTSNIDSLKEFGGKEKPAEPEPVAKPEEGKEPMDFQIDQLDLKIGKVVLKEYSGKAKPSVNVYDINLEQRYENVISTRRFVTALLLEHMNQFVLQAIQNVGLDEVRGLLGDSVDAIGKFGKEAVNAVTGVGKGAIGEAEKILKGTKEGLENIIKLPFGGK